MADVELIWAATVLAIAGTITSRKPCSLHASRFKQIAAKTFYFSMASQVYNDLGVKQPCRAISF